MQHATSISAEEQRIAAMRSGAGLPGDGGWVSSSAGCFLVVCGIYNALLFALCFNGLFCVVAVLLQWFIVFCLRLWVDVLLYTFFFKRREFVLVVTFSVLKKVDYFVSTSTLLLKLSAADFCLLRTGRESHQRKRGWPCSLQPHVSLHPFSHLPYQISQHLGPSTSCYSQYRCPRPLSLLQIVNNLVFKFCVNSLVNPCSQYRILPCFLFNLCNISWVTVIVNTASFNNFCILRFISFLQSISFLQ